MKKNLLTTLTARSEHEDQCAVIQWADRNIHRYPYLGLLFAIPNGGNRNVVTAKRLKAEGVKAGVPDLFLPVARGGHHGLFIELKKKGGRKPTKIQLQWLEDLGKQGYATYARHGSDAAIILISAYIKGLIKKER